MDDVEINKVRDDVEIKEAFIFLFYFFTFIVNQNQYKDMSRAKITSMMK